MSKMSTDPDRQALSGPTMGTRWSVRCDAEEHVDADALQRALAAAVAKVDMQMSPWKPASQPSTFQPRARAFFSQASLLT